jgi:hypothetical protein
MYPALPVQRLAGRAGAASCPPGSDLGGVAEPGILGSGITWYDVLGVMPGAEPRKIKRKYDDKASLLRPELISDAPLNVVTAVGRAQELLDTAWRVLGDPQSRRRYDEAVGLRRSDGGLGQPGTGIESAGLTPAGPGIIGELPGVTRRAACSGWPAGWGRAVGATGPAPSRTSAGSSTARAWRWRPGVGFTSGAVRVTQRPMAVEGLVVDQDPRPPTTTDRGGTLTVQVWHPPARPVAPAGSGRSSP